MTELDRCAELHKLAALRDEGVLTPSEYQAQEDRVLRLPVAALADDATFGDRPPRRRRRMAERENFTALLAVLCAIDFWPVGIILGYQALAEARRTGGGDERLAIVALVISYVAAAVTIALIVLRASS
jgi:hypothetical protein